MATSIQDQGRFGFRAAGYSRSGAMDPLSLLYANRLAGASDSSAAVELGPGPCTIQVVEATTIAFGGARRDGAPWWETIQADAGYTVALSAPRDGVWSYFSIEGGIAAHPFLGSRSTQVREGIGRWLVRGEVLSTAAEVAVQKPVEPPNMSGPIRVFGRPTGEWKVGGRQDRMGYELEGLDLERGSKTNWSEPLLPGCIQLLPSGRPIVLMAEGPTVGGYEVCGVVHSQDLRLLAQTPTGAELSLVSV